MDHLKPLLAFSGWYFRLSSRSFSQLCLNFVAVESPSPKQAKSAVSAITCLSLAKLRQPPENPISGIWFPVGKALPLAFVLELSGCLQACFPSEVDKT